MLNTKNQILFIYHRVLLQLKKSRSFCEAIFKKNAKPPFQYLGFAVFKPKRRDQYDQSRALFWLKYNISGLK